jgi:hypothetical protein
MKALVLGIVLVLIVAAFVALSSAQKKKYVVSEVDGRKHEVLDTVNCVAAADMIATLEANVRELLKRSETVAPGDKRFAAIRSRWSGKLVEINGGDNIAYSVDKSDVSMCVRRSDGTVENYNDLMFVLLHELSHIANETYGHDDRFWKTFKFVLEVADKTGVYAFQDYGRDSVTVCGKVISTTPLACVKSGECFSELGPIRPGPIRPGPIRPQALPNSPSN